MVRNIFLLKSRSLLIRLLWPVNLISTVLLIGFAITLSVQNRTTLDTALRAKAEVVSKLLVQMGEHYIGTKDQAQLSKYASRLDADVQFVSFFDSTNHLIGEHTSRTTSEDIMKVDSEIRDVTGAILGHVTIGYATDEISHTFWRSLAIACVYGFFVQLFLSSTILYVCKNVIDPLNLSFLNLSRSTQVLSVTSKDISKFSESLSIGVSQQAEVVQETTAAMAEMSSTLNQTSEYAKQSQDVMISMTKTANNGMNIMNQMVDAMTSVHHANEQLKSIVNMIQEISTKTNVINDIVFKTQLLSFNASIEAARAGQHGRGFAVVAEEVGNLAKMSGKASQEIGSILLDSERQVNEIVKNTSERVQIGRQVTEQALRNFKDISREIDSIASRIDNITTASREQELGVAQTTHAMRELNKTTEINNQVAQKSSSAAYVLKEETRSLHAIARSISESILGQNTSQEDFDLKARQNLEADKQQNERKPSNQGNNGEGDVFRKIVGMAKTHNESSDNKTFRNPMSKNHKDEAS